MADFKYDESISLDLIDPNPMNPKIYSEDDVEHLAAKIKEEGFKHPVKLFDKGDGRYEISSGHRRVRAMKILGKKAIPSIIAPMPKKEYERTRDLLSGNLEQRKTTPLERALEIEEYKKSLDEEKYTGNKRAKIAEYFNITESNVYRYECILRLIPELQEFCKKPDFPYSSLRAASSLTKKEQQAIYEKLIELEAANKQVTEDEVDVDEIVFSRTRIEQIINNTIRQSERKKEEGKPVTTSPEFDSDNDLIKAEEEETWISAPGVKPSDMDDTTDMSEYLVDDDEDKVLEMDEHCDSISTRGIEDCINTIKAYKKLKYNETAKSTLRGYIKELKELLAQLEKMVV